MTVEFNEKEFINEVGQEYFNSLALQVYKLMMQMPEQHNGEPVHTFATAFDIVHKHYKTVAIVASSKTRSNGMRDFGFHKFWFSTDDVPDEILDFMNDSDVRVAAKDELRDAHQKVKSDDQDYMFIELPK